MTASAADKALARRIMTWAWANGMRPNEVQVLRNLPAWSARYCAALAGRTQASPADEATRPIVPAVDQAVTIAEAAATLGVSERTVRRYLSPSSGKLVRLAAGVSERSVEAYFVARAANIARTRWAKGARLALRAA